MILPGNGKVLLRNIISFKIIHNEYVGVRYFRKGIVIKYKEKGKIREAVFSARKSKFISFVKNLKFLKIKEI